MKNILVLILSVSMLGSLESETQNINYERSTAAVILAGGVLDTKPLNSDEKKYPRKDCPVCKGKGWYMSGDGIQKIECDYCEESKLEEISMFDLDIKEKENAESAELKTIPEQSKQDMVPSKNIIIYRK